MSVSCDPFTLSAAAKCFACFGAETLSEIRTFLLCQWANIASGAGEWVEWTPANIDINSLIGKLGDAQVAPNNMVGIQTITISDIDNDQGYDFIGNATVQTITFSGLVALSNASLFTFSIQNMSALTVVNFPVLVNPVFSPLLIASNPALTTISMPVVVPPDGCNWQFTGNALTQSIVDAILQRWVDNPAQVSGILDLSGGTSSTPSAAGLANVATLNGRGCTVTTN